jgi:hypothetical protein
MTTEERAEALVKRLDRSNLSEWPDIVASAIREAENNILAQASERLEGEDAQLSHLRRGQRPLCANLCTNNDSPNPQRRRFQATLSATRYSEAGKPQ